MTVAKGIGVGGSLPSLRASVGMLKRRYMSCDPSRLHNPYLVPGDGVVSCARDRRSTSQAANTLALSVTSTRRRSGDRRGV